jgi:hypothetical protein
MNLQSLESVIAPHNSRERQRRAWRLARLVTGWLEVCLFAAAALSLDHRSPLANPSMTAKDDAPADIVAITQTKDGDLRLGTGVNG